MIVFILLTIGYLFPFAESSSLTPEKAQKIADELVSKLNVPRGCFKHDMNETPSKNLAAM
jgi:hypothetical protein